MGEKVRVKSSGLRRGYPIGKANATCARTPTTYTGCSPSSNTFFQGSSCLSYGFLPPLPLALEASFLITYCSRYGYFARRTACARTWSSYESPRCLAQNPIFGYGRSCVCPCRFLWFVFNLFRSCGSSLTTILPNRTCHRRHHLSCTALKLLWKGQLQRCGYVMFDAVAQDAL